MFDGLKLVTYCNNIEEILVGLGVKVHQRRIDSEGTLIWSKATYRHMFIKFFPSGRVCVDGSLHKYYKGENSSDFTLPEIIDSVRDLCEKFDFDPTKVQVSNLEFGVNILTPFESFEFSENAITYWEGKRRFKLMDDEDPPIGYSCKRSEYVVKLYGKGLQTNRGLHLTRFELSVNRMRAIIAAKIKTLSDLTIKTKLEVLGKMLNKTYSNIVFTDKVDTKKLTNREREIYILGSNPREWENMPRWKRVRFKQRFNAIIKKYGQNQWSETCKRLIDEKWHELLGFSSQSANVLPNNLDRVDSPICKRSPSYGKMGECYTIRNQSPRFCKSCGRDISHQKKGSVFCSESKFGKDAKRCRNKDSNPRNHFLLREERLYGGLNLFEVSQFLRKNE